MENKKKILLVDDDESITRTLKLFLDRRGGYEVRTENRGSQAVQVARDFRPDLIVLDIVMPDADGGAIAQDLGEDPPIEIHPDRLPERHHQTERDRWSGNGDR